MNWWLLSRPALICPVPWARRRKKSAAQFMIPCGKRRFYPDWRKKVRHTAVKCVPFMKK